MSVPLYEIHGTGVHNRGAVLMAEAIAERLRSVHPGIRLAVSASFGPYETRSRLGLSVTDAFPGRLAGPYVRFAPNSVRRILGIVSAQEVSAVLDATGFGFSDQMGPRQAEVLLDKMNRPERRKQKLVLLPQAFGPFHQPEIANVCRRLFERAGLIFARDPDSQKAVNELLGEKKARLAPDFTIGVKPLAAPKMVLPQRFAAIVPNFRMLQRSEDGGGEYYQAVLGKLIEHLQEIGLDVVFVLHSADEDRPLSSTLAERHGGLPVLEHSDPRVLKWVLGQAEAVVGSRFHALVSTLSQGVPAIGLGWSHKYEWLFKDFGCPECLLSVESSGDVVDIAASNLSGKAQRDYLCNTLATRLQVLRQDVENMWITTEKFLGVHE